MTASTPNPGPRDDDTLDVVVIGGGAAGLNGAMMLARSRRRVVVVDGGAPRNAPAAAMHGALGLDGTPPLELLERGRDEVTGYGGTIISGTVVAAEPASPAPDDDPLFTVTLTDRTLVTRRLLVATGVRDNLPDIPGLQRHWGGAVVHCPYCHGWEVRDQPIGILGTGPVSLHQALLFRQLTDDLVYFTTGAELDAATRARFDARNITVVDTPVASVLDEADGGIAGVRLTDGTVVARRVLAVATTMEARTDGLSELHLPTEDLPHGMGRRIVSGMAGSTEVPGVWVAGNATDPTAQVGASAAAGALAGAHINADLATADADRAVASLNP